MAIVGRYWMFLLMRSSLGKCSKAKCHSVDSQRYSLLLAGVPQEIKGTGDYVYFLSHLLKLLLHPTKSECNMPLDSK